MLIKMFALNIYNFSYVKYSSVKLEKKHIVFYFTIRKKDEKYTEKKIAKFSLAWYTPRIMAKVSKMVAVFSIATWMAALLASICGRPLSSAMRHLAIYWSYWAVESIRGRAYNTHSGKLLDDFSYFHMPLV